MDIFHTFTVQTAKIARLIQRIKTEEMEEFSLKGLHVSCLYYVYHQPEGITLKELCEACEEDKAAVSRSLTQLENDGYIRREGDEGKYKYQIRLTEQGEKIASRVDEKINRILGEVRLGLDEEEEKIFYKNLLKIADSLEKVCQRYED